MYLKCHFNFCFIYLFFYSRLASWNCNPGRLVEEQMIHMQVALYALFLRLYGMFPCNFLAYLRTQYKDKNRAVFIHTIKVKFKSIKIYFALMIFL
jgi:tuberous sclerosis protein 1